MIVPQDNVVVLLYSWLYTRYVYIVALIHGCLHVDCALIGQEPACQVPAAAWILPEAATVKIKRKLQPASCSLSCFSDDDSQKDRQTDNRIDAGSLSSMVLDNR